MISLNSILFIYIIPILLGYFIWRYGLKNLILDWFRQQLFEARDELFKTAMDNSLEFDSEFYRNVERRLNLFIRFAHRFNAFNLIVSDIAVRLNLYTPRDNNVTKSVGELDGFQELSKDVQEKILTIEESLFKNLRMFILLYSPPTLFIIMLYSLKVVIKDGNMKLRTKFKHFIIALIGRDIDMSEYKENRIITPGFG